MVTLGQTSQRSPDEAALRRNEARRGLQPRCLRFVLADHSRHVTKHCGRDTNPVLRPAQLGWSRSAAQFGMGMARNPTDTAVLPVGYVLGIRVYRGPKPGLRFAFDFAQPGRVGRRLYRLPTRNETRIFGKWWAT